MAAFHSFRQQLRRVWELSIRTQRKKRASSGRLAVEVLEDRVAPAGDILVTGSLQNVGNVFQEYTPAGALVRTLTVPPPPNDSFTWVASIAQDSNGNVYVWDGRSTLALAVYNAQSGNWSQLTYPQGWSTGYQAGQTGVAVYGHYAYVSNETSSSGQPTVGVIRFDLDTGVGTDFNPFNSGTVSVAIGLDGNLYALGDNTVYELDPNTMALENTIHLPNESYIGLAVDAAGNIYMASSDGTIDSFDPTGTQIATTTLAGGPASIAIASDGTLAVGTRYNGVVQKTTAFTNVTTFNVGDGGADVAFAQVAPPGPASPAESNITFAPGTVQSGTMTATVTLTAKDSSGYRENAGGLDVQFGVGAGTANGIFSGLTDNGDGTYTALFTGTTPGTNTITATINGQPVTSTLPSVTVTPSAPAGNILVTNQPYNGTPVFEELTQDGTVVRSVPVPSGSNLGSVAEGANGDVYIYEGDNTHVIAVYDPSTGAWSQFTYAGWGNGNFGLALDSHYAFTSNVTGGSGRASGGIIRFDLATGVPTRFNSYGVDLTNANLGLDGNLYALGGGTVYVINPITMALEKTVALPFIYSIGGMAVNASGDLFIVDSSSGTVDHFSPTGTLLDTVSLLNGIGTLTSIAIASDGTLAVGTYSGTVVRMTSAFTNVTEFAGGPFVAFTPPPLGPAAPSRSLVTVASPSISVGGTTTVTLVARDANDLAETSGGLTVAFQLGGGSSVGTIGPVTDNGDGTYTATFTAGNFAGANTVTATINGQPVTSPPPTITVAPTPFDLATSTVAISETLLQAGIPATVTLQAEDPYGNDETSGGLGVAFALGGGAGSGTFGPVVDNGNGTYTATFTGTTLGSNSITATINGQAVTSPAPTFTVNPGPVSASLSTVALTQQAVAAGSMTTVTLTALDAGGNPYTDLANVSFFFIHGSSANGTFSSATNLGNGVYSATVTGAGAGSGGVSAIINGVVLTSAAPILTVTPSTPDHFTVTVSNGAATVAAQDAFNNTATSFAGSVHVDSVNNASVPISYTYAPSDFGRHKFSLSTTSGVTVTNLTTASGPAPDNVMVQADFDLAAGQFGGLVTRYSGPTDKLMYWGGIIPNPKGAGFVAYIGIINTAGLKPLTSYVPVKSPNGTLYFEADGSSLELFWQAAGSDALEFLTAANDTTLTTGTAGVRLGQGVTANNIIATALTPATTATLPFSEDFTNPNYPTTANFGLNTNWQDQAGVISIVNNSAVGDSAINDATLNGVNANNVSVQATIDVQAGQSAGLIARYQGKGDENMYWGGVTASGSKFDASIMENVNGVWTSLSPATPVAGGGQGTLLFVTIGTSLKLYWQPAGVNGFSLVGAATNAKFSTGAVGLRLTANAAATNFSAAVASTPTPQNATIPFSENFGDASYPVNLGSQLSSFWTNQTGDVSIINGNATGQAAVNTALLNGVTQANVALQADVDLKTGQSVGLAARCSGTGNKSMYLAQVISSGSHFEVGIWIDVNGTLTLLTSLDSIGSNGQGTLQFTTTGTQLQLYWNGNLIVSATNSKLANGGVGMSLSQGAQIGNFNAS